MHLTFSFTPNLVSQSWASRACCCGSLIIFTVVNVWVAIIYDDNYNEPDSTSRLSLIIAESTGLEAILCVAERFMVLDMSAVAIP